MSRRLKVHTSRDKYLCDIDYVYGALVVVLTYGFGRGTADLLC